MKNLATAYTYNPTAKTLTLTGLNVPLSYLLLVVNATRGTIIYNLADPALAAANFVQAANSVLTLNASVDTSFHNAADALTIFYDDGVQSNTVLIQGPAGPQGETGDPGSTTWDGITDKPATFAPSAHKSTHATAGSDALTPSDISATWRAVSSSQNISGDTTLPAGRNRIITLIGTGATANVDLPSTGNEEGDTLVLLTSFFVPSNFTIRRPSGTPPFINLLTFTASGQSASFYFAQGVWNLRRVDLHTHAIADTTGLQSALDAKASTSALAALEARVAALEAAQSP